MPRTKKTPEQRRKDKSQEAQLSEYWGGRIQAGLKVRQEYEDTAKKVMGFLKPQHRELFDSPDLASQFMDFQGSMTLSVPAIAKMKNSLAPQIYMSEPARNVAYRGNDNVLKGLARVIQTYLNYTAKETNQAKQLRNASDDGLIRGRCFLRQVWDAIRKLITSTYVSSLDVVVDPDFTSLQDVQWIAIRHREPLWQVKRRVPKKALTRGLEKICDAGKSDEDKDKGIAGSTRIVEWWEVLSKMGNGARGIDLEDSGISDEEDFVRLEVVVGHDRLLAVGQWDVPLYLDRDWPISMVDFLELPDEPWPVSPAGQVVPLQGGIDLLTSVKLNGCKQRDRVVMCVDAEIDRTSQDTLKNGTSSDFVAVKLPPGRTLDSAVKVLDFGPGSPETTNERAFLLNEMETTMGSTQVVTGGPDAGPQDRSATASSMRGQATQTRVGDLKNKVSELYTDASRKEAVMVRLFLTEEDVARYVRPSDLALFYVSIELADSPPMPVRKVSIEDEEGNLVEQEVLTLQDLAPQLSTYYDTPDEAAQAMAMFWEELQGRVDLESVQLRDALVQGGVDPVTMLPLGMSIAPVTAERVWQDTSGMTAEEILDELSYSIETGAGIKFNKDAERANTDNLLQTLLPVVSQMGDVVGMNKLLDMRFDAYDVPQEKRFKLNPPPPPVQAPQGDKKEPPK